jgi:hypothetical protein
MMQSRGTRSAGALEWACTRGVVCTQRKARGGAGAPAEAGAGEAAASIFLAADGGRTAAHHAAAAAEHLGAAVGSLRGAWPRDHAGQGAGSALALACLRLAPRRAGVAPHCATACPHVADVRWGSPAAHSVAKSSTIQGWVHSSWPRQ